jgi:hypothetical protein
MAAADFLGPLFRRQQSESDASFSARIRSALIREHATRPATINGLRALTGTTPAIFEPARPGDTGAYGSGSGGSHIQAYGLAYGAAGGWGSLKLPWQFFVSVTRPPVPGLANLSGYDVPAAGYCRGPISYVGLSSLPGRVDDCDIRQTVRDLIPVNATAWLRIT